MQFGQRVRQPLLILLKFAARLVDSETEPIAVRCGLLQLLLGGLDLRSEFQRT